MFKIENYEVNPETGETSFNIAYDLGNGPKAHHYIKTTAEDAQRVIDSNLFTYLWDTFLRYVEHSKAIAMTGKPEFYQTDVRSQAMEKCEKAARYFDGQPVLEVCRVILLLKFDLRKIFPHEYNTSFHSSCTNVEEMINLAQDRLDKVALKSVAINS